MRREGEDRRKDRLIVLKLSESVFVFVFCQVSPPQVVQASLSQELGEKRHFIDIYETFWHIFLDERTVFLLT
jgi:hypothetical protein